MSLPRGPAYRIETARTRLRCFEPQDTPLLEQAIGENIEHLASSMDSIRHEPQGFERRLVWVRTQRGHFDLDSDYTYGIFPKEGTPCLGVALLKLSPEPGERELGYWIHKGHLRKGLATEVCAALLRVAFELEALSCIELSTLPENEASRGVALKLGFSGPRIQPAQHTGPHGEVREVHVYTLSRAEYGAMAQAQIAAYDVLGRPLIAP
jgi:RimJ/RimL family protein N-acetyltransferase